ncbi:MauE/DoxX family redox-associated membrane protein [Lutibacter flavus]|uniref:Methylamine utilisation protein MauE n=1 Tax=Lutibacter flavus TaxID=691689 RepID=A0A238YCD9_9FLAO|nr:MauE/DoxX family redox-associated membrane protein [Lutibacter flavus]SNR68468.1 Methylamine utilisation protein MauE [Lutibacter flavus]
MKFSLRKNIISIICYLYVFMLVYAATSKLLDFENFKIQLGQSPLLSSFADWITILVPVTEYIIASLLLIPKFRFIGLFTSYLLMVLFTAYIYIILNYSAFVPCSCGGILEKMTWNQHLVFNIIFIFLAAFAILLTTEHPLLFKRKTVKL